MRLELLVDAAIASLKAGLPARVAALNATTTDFDVPVPADEAYYYGVQSEIWLWPAVEVAAPDFDLTALSLEQLDGDLSPLVMVMVWQQDTDRVRLWRTLDRLSHCVAQVLLQPAAFGAGVIVQTVAGRTRLNPETRDAAEVTAGFLHVYQLADLEQRPV